MTQFGEYISKGTRPAQGEVVGSARTAEHEMGVICVLNKKTLGVLSSQAHSCHSAGLSLPFLRAYELNLGCNKDAHQFTEACKGLVWPLILRMEGAYATKPPSLRTTASASWTIPSMSSLTVLTLGIRPTTCP